MARTGDATIDYGTLLGDGIELVVDSATLIDTAARRVRPASGRALDYDYVVHAVGSIGTTPPSVPGAAEFAVPLAEFEDAERLRARLEELPRDAPVTVVGGGLTGIETAAELAERGRAVTLVCGRTLAPTFSAAGRGRPRRCFRRWPCRPCAASERADRLGRGIRRTRIWRWRAGCTPTRSAVCSPTRQ
ncbi:FAD-dependent oxidoreductase [Streptomyces sp. MN13]